MNSITLRGNEIFTKDDLFTALRTSATLPSSCGKNLDALADVITEAAPVHIVVKEPQQFCRHLGDWGVRCLKMLKALTAKYHHITLTIEEENQES